MEPRVMAYSQAYRLRVREVIHSNGVLRIMTDGRTRLVQRARTHPGGSVGVVAG